MDECHTYTDTQLVLLLQQEDGRAFTEVYRRHWHFLFVHALKVLGNADEAKDLVQDVFFAFWEKAKVLEVHTNLKGYLYTATRNRIFSHIRRRKVSEQFVNLLQEELDGLDHATVQQIDEAELSRLIDAEIAALPPRMRRVFELSRKDFLSHKEIALQLGMTEEAVKKQIHRAIRILRKRLGHYAGFYLLLCVVSTFPEASEQIILK